MFAATLTFDKTAYKPGEVVKATATYTNVSGRTCYWVSPTMSFLVYNAAGAELTRGSTLIADGVNWIAVPPGGAQTKSSTWDQVDHSNGGAVQAAPGTYEAVDTYVPFGQAKASLQLVGA